MINNNEEIDKEVEEFNFENDDIQDSTIISDWSQWVLSWEVQSIQWELIIEDNSDITNWIDISYDTVNPAIDVYINNIVTVDESKLNEWNEKSIRLNKSGNRRWIWRKQGDMPCHKQDDLFVQAKIEAAVILGANTEQICLAARISRPTYYKILKNNPEFAERLEIAQSALWLVAKKTLAARIEKDPDGSLALKYLERTEPWRYAPKQTIQTNLIPIVETTSEEQDSLLDSLLND